MTGPVRTHLFKGRHFHQARWVAALVACLGACLVCLLPTSAPLYAADETPQIESFTARPLFDGLYREGGWAVVEISITNGPRPFQGEVRTSFSILYNASTGEYSNSTPVSLAPSQKLTFFHYVQPYQRSSFLTLDLYDNRGKKVADTVQRLQVTSSSDFYVGVLNDEAQPPDLPRVGFLSLRGNSISVRVLPLSTDQISDRKESLNLFNGLLVGHYDLKPLAPEKRRAILGWVADGGELFLSGGTYLPARLQALDLDSSLLPASTSATAKLDRISMNTYADSTLEQLGNNPMVVSRLVPNQGGFVAGRQSAQASEPGLPLIVARKVGQGSIVMSAGDVFAPPMINWNRITNYWSQLILAGDSDFTINNTITNFFTQDVVSRAMISAPGAGTPDGSITLLLLLVYAALLGPASYLLLKRFGQTWWYWVTTPVIALAVAGVIIVIGSYMPVGEINLNRVSIIESASDDLPSNFKSLLATYANLDTPYQLQLNGPPSLLRPDPVSLTGQINFMPPGKLVQGTSSAIVSSEQRQNRLETFAAEGMVDLKLNLESQLSTGSNLIKGSLVNRGSYSFKEVVLVYGDNFYYLGDWKPGEEKKVNFPLTRRPALSQRPSIDPNVYVPVSLLESGQVPVVPTPGQPNPWLSGSTPEARQANLYWTTLNTAFQGKRFGLTELNHALYLTGWVDTKGLFGKSQADDQKVVQQETALVIRPLPLSYSSEGGVTYVPPEGLYPERLGDSSTASFNIITLSQTAVQFQYRLPSELVYARFQPTRFSVYINAFRDRDRSSVIPQSQVQGWREPVPPGQYQSNPRLEIYNWEKGSWEEASPQGDTRARIDLTLTNLNEYIDRNIGTIRLRVSANGEPIVLQQVNLEVEGQTLS